MDVKQADKLNTFSVPSAVIKATFVFVDKILFKSILCNYFIGRQTDSNLSLHNSTPFIAIQIL